MLALGGVLLGFGIDKPSELSCTYMQSYLLSIHTSLPFQIYLSGEEVHYSVLVGQFKYSPVTTVTVDLWE